jgi:hypothetical protein
MAFSSKIFSWVGQHHHRSGLHGRWLAFCELDRKGSVFIGKGNAHLPDGYSKTGCRKTLYLLSKPDDLGDHGFLSWDRHMDGLPFRSYIGIDLSGGNLDLHQTIRRKRLEAKNTLSHTPFSKLEDIGHGKD